MINYNWVGHGTISEWLIGLGGSRILKKLSATLFYYNGGMHVDVKCLRTLIILGRFTKRTNLNFWEPSGGQKLENVGALCNVNLEMSDGSRVQYALKNENCLVMKHRKFKILPNCSVGLNQFSIGAACKHDCPRNLRNQMHKKHITIVIDFFDNKK